jgi:hypothetical protein
MTNRQGNAGQFRKRALQPNEEIVMKYGLAWLLGVPPILIVGWFVLKHC